jgi:hypothetical protein
MIMMVNLWHRMRQFQQSDLTITDDGHAMSVGEALQYLSSKPAVKCVQRAASIFEGGTSI